MLMRMYLRLFESCIQDSASCVVPAAVARSESLSKVVAFSALPMSVGYAASCMPMQAVHLYFHSSKVA